MNYRFLKQKISVLLFLFIVGHTVIAQIPDLKLTAAAAHTISNNTYSIDFTIGESATANVGNAFSVFTIGFLQPVVQQQLVAASSNFVLLYPVPATNEINYIFSDLAFSPTAAQILNITGSVIKSATIPTNIQTGQALKFNIASLPSGIYRIRFINSLGETKVSTFIKL